MDPDGLADVERVPHGGSDDRDLVDFSANTNPVRPAGVADVYEAALADATRYADGFDDFRAAAAEYVGRESDDVAHGTDRDDHGAHHGTDDAGCTADDVIPTAGGLAALRLAFGVTVSPGDRVLVPEPSFGEYAREIRLQGGDPVGVAHGELLDRDPADYAAAVVCNPNNPTGELRERDALDAFRTRCRAVGTPLVVDEAFLDFTDAPSLAGEPGAIVVRSLTKMFGLPGIRAGFAVAVGDLGDRLRTARPTWALSTPAAAVGTHCLRQTDFVERTRERVAGERTRMREALSERYAVAPSDAPFLLVDVGDERADPDAAVETVLARARDGGVAVRDARTFERLDSHVRVAVRRPHENDLLLDALLDR
ncbi:aminotransferase class I/II-fold pyridoxal phosphate-dependent enzyme [Halobellus limi]|jgi:threonine-phosphate decarboxylase|uniref:Aminotransferase n=1 Tax=Halobellus limi TaxID=699433 RepID=A0A1H5YMR9_9EURY|nr:aminotransferase class I/II-fold pyridoxal phosphate-dependent enzyme [Halobellus limi]QCC48414.1 pyridoxal phosphate-dependent class II aminotransferase [Halobellus limi]SEG24676.1 L-threonine O-3-phosphate decarboxylase [Halobellus limi]